MRCSRCEELMKVSKRIDFREGPGKLVLVCLNEHFAIAGLGEEAPWAPSTDGEAATAS